jgi:hypothetical protein
MTEDDIESTRLSSRKVDAVGDHTRLSSRKVDAADDHTRLSSRKVDAADDHTRLSSRKVETPIDATSMSARREQPLAVESHGALAPPPASLGALPVAVHGSFGGAATSYGAREVGRVRSVSIARGSAPQASGASVASPEARAAKEAKRRRARLLGWGIGAAAVLAVVAAVAVLTWR